MKYYKLSIFIVLICFVVAFRAGSEETMQTMPRFPLGKNVGPVEFDCTIELVAPVTKELHAFFMRYQVSAKEIAYDIHWVEPAWLHVDFPYPPFGLSLYADDSRFIMYSSWNDKRWEHDRSDKRPDVFNFTCGNYPIDEQRHAYSEALLGRLFVGDIKTITSKEQKYDTLGTLIFGHPVTHSESRRGLMTDSFGFSADMLFFGVNLRKNPQEYKEIVYHFEDNRLVRLVGHLRERTVPVSGFEIEAKTNDFPEGITITQLPAKYHEGDRSFKTLFTDMNIGTNNVTLPKKITIEKGKINDRSFLREATLSTYRPVTKMTTPANIGTFFSDAPYFDEEQKFRKLSTAYWLKKPEDVSDEHIQWFRDFADQCLERYAGEKFLPDRLRLLHMAIVSDLHTNNIERIEKETFSLHLSELTDNGFSDAAAASIKQFLDLCKQWNISVQLDACRDNDSKMDPQCDSSVFAIFRLLTLIRTLLTTAKAG
jgi:hypothetical protein